MNDDSALNPESFVLVLSVGGSIEPLIRSIGHYNPRRVVFVASRDSNPRVREILERVEGIGRHETITLEDHQRLLPSLRDIRRELPRRLDAMNVPPGTLLLTDFTGGTKAMSAALTLAMIEYKSRFTYVGGDIRGKDGLGTVESGHETVIFMDDPWYEMGLREARSLELYFNAGQYDAAREQVRFLKSRDSEYSAFYDGLGMVIEAFHNWDIFNYKKAMERFSGGINRLAVYNNRNHKNFRPQYARLKDAFDALERVAADAVLLKGNFRPLNAGEGDAYVRDLVANARRCAVRGHYDDAVARLYSAIEKTAKIALARMGLDNSDFPKDALAQAGGGLAEKHGEDPDGKIRLPLNASFAALCGFAPEHAVARAYKANSEALEKALRSRNMSLLAHGYNPVEEKAYRKLYDIALQFLGIKEEELVKFPELDVNSILF